LEYVTYSSIFRLDERMGAREFSAAYLNAAGKWSLESGDQSQHGRFATAAGAE
jgi:hypothetical protein